MSFNRDELIGFLSELDRQLKRQTELVVTYLQERI